jgi:hypothetical protein
VVLEESENKQQVEKRKGMIQGNTKMMHIEGESVV